MGEPKTAPAVKYFVTALTSDRSLLEGIHVDLEAEFGELERPLGQIHDWDYSPAYTRELGEGIKRRFHVVGALGRPEHLPDWKVATNAVEQRYAADSTGRRRRINLDPGYVTGSQVVLASTKRYHNRVYLRDGIWADLTLVFDGRTFRQLKGLTLPDYRTRSAIEFFNGVRKRYMDQLRAPSPGAWQAVHTAESRDLRT
jgi:hypothetical protein